MGIREAGLYLLKTAAYYYVGIALLVVHGEASYFQGYGVGMIAGIFIGASEMVNLLEKERRN